MARPKLVVMLAVPNVQLLDVSGPMDVFAEANRQAGREVYRLRLVAAARGAVRASSGVRLVPDGVVGEKLEQGIDTLLVAGAPDAADTDFPRRVIDWLALAAPRARRYGSVCSGAFLLAAAGLADGRTLTTHWNVAERFMQAYPNVKVDLDALYVRDGRLRTAAGVTAGLDLALALVEEDLGRELAMQVAAQLVMFFKRPGGQSQFIRHGRIAPSGRSALQQVQRWVARNPAHSHGVADLAERAGMSPRHFSRVFHQEIGLTPAAWVEAARIAAARKHLEEGAAPKAVAFDCGFSSADTLRRVFMRHVGVTPAQYRRRYQ